MIRHAAVVVAEPVMRRTNGQRSAATQAQVLDAAIDCLVELGYARTTTTEVARRAGVSRGAQTHHFPTKDDLVLAAIDHLLARRNREFQRSLRGSARSAADARLSGADPPRPMLR